MIEERNVLNGTSNVWKWIAVGFSLLFVGICINTSNAHTSDDLDPLVDIEVTVDIIAIRVLDDWNVSTSPDFFIQILINSEEYWSPVWNATSYLYDLHWTATLNVPDDNEQVDITIAVYDKTMDGTNIKTTRHTAEMTYSIKTGYWNGDDSVGDSSGYGRLKSGDDENFARGKREYELWFTIFQTDHDGDGIPYWTEVYMYGTNPEVDNTGDDLDGDFLPIEWEHQWRYHPLIWDDHSKIDNDFDSLTNVEEYRVSSWGSDPYRQDLFIEIDVMAEGPLGQNSSVPPHAKELLKTAFHRHNIVVHLDDGCMGGGGDIIPFDDETYRYELRSIYTTYFLKNDSGNWRRSVFRYAMIIYQQKVAAAVAYVGEHPWLYWHTQGINTFVISAQSMQNKAQKTNTSLDKILACVMMHETGHTFGIDFLFPLGCDNIRTSRPHTFAYWLFRNYKSCMNYRYTYSLLDYSDGSHGGFDYDDWENLDFSFFEKRDDI
ncbi:MAG: hypothetical protein JXA75_02795 [Candidatus Thermoplasmatota archaeon]|nr:hypothetical protein [Candidatus Thermoplasmatota archaeon]